MKKIIILFIIFVGCQQKKCNELDGMWLIKSIIVDNNDYLNLLQVNSFSFNCENKTGFVPGCQNFQRDLHTRWEIIEGKNNDVLKIKTINKIFNDSFNFKIINKNNNTVLYMESNSVKIIAIKAFK
jgi:hypothetical protein